ncbi:MAG TPA: ATP-binding cassette domain-containing protein [Pseudonocardiaceae bacterium]|jgi:ABC-type multidrug transport system ATPase subunit|nr:ATP-binding cassette domain-containing protein [Pseudonocardiaceae bacterium]
MSETTGDETAEHTLVDGAPVPTEPAPLLVAERLGHKGGHGWAFRDVDLTLPVGGLTAIAGRSGSGRTMLLLTLAGRAKPSSGRLAVAGDTAAKAIRAAVAVGRITGVAEPEPDLRVHDHVRELHALAGRGVDYGWARDLVGLSAPGHTLVDDLDAARRCLLALALAVATRPRAVVLDDVDQQVDGEQQRQIWAALRAVTGAGIAVLASCVDPAVAIAADADVLTLPAPDPAQAEDEL